jgi:hypothetical protein
MKKKMKAERKGKKKRSKAKSLLCAFVDRVRMYTMYVVVVSRTSY